MAYAHAQTDPRAKLGSLLFVGGLHAAVGMGLVAALGVTAIIEDKGEVTVAINIPVEPTPKPVEPVKTPEPVVQQTSITAPDPITPLTQPSKVEVNFPDFTKPTEVGAPGRSGGWPHRITTSTATDFHAYTARPAQQPARLDHDG